MKIKLIKYYNLLKKLYEDYKCLSFDGDSLDDNESLKQIYDRLINVYCEFIDMYSDFCDSVIENNNVINLENVLNQSMVFYFMMNKEYFASKTPDEDVKNIEHILNQLEPHKDILEYEFEFKEDDSPIICEVCGGEGDIPDCVLCGRPADYNNNNEAINRINNENNR